MTGLAIAHILTVLVCSAVAADGTISIHIAGEENISGVRTVIKDDLTFISMDDVGERLDIEIKKLGDGMIGLCQEEICIAVQLDNERDAIRDSGELMINIDLIAQSISSKAEWLISGKALHFVPGDQVLLDTIIKIGDVIPNFALPSITDGKMVSFSSFRGKRVLLFMWATW